MVTGKCADIGKFKIPGMRGLAARPPYFHSGTAPTLLDVVNFTLHPLYLPVHAVRHDVARPIALLLRGGCAKQDGYRHEDEARRG